MELINLIKFNIWQQQLSGSSTVVDHLTPDSEIKGLKPAPASHHEKMVEKQCLNCFDSLLDFISATFDILWN
jgi:hypothetical protein